MLDFEFNLCFVLLQINVRLASSIALNAKKFHFVIYHFSSLHSPTLPAFYLVGMKYDMIGESNWLLARLDVKILFLECLIS